MTNPTHLLTRRLCSAHGGSYSIYYALALASKELKADHRYATPQDHGIVSSSVAKNLCAGLTSPTRSPQPKLGPFLNGETRRKL